MSNDTTQKALRAGQFAGKPVIVAQLDTETWRAIEASIRIGHMPPSAISYYNAWAGCTITFTPAGTCCNCGTMTWDASEPVDVRGPVGLRLADPFQPEEYNSTGPEVPCCWGCRNNDGATWQRAQRKAAAHWTRNDAAPAAPLTLTL
jgi:hypothetical protein